MNARRGIRIRPPQTLFKREEAIFAEAIDSFLRLDVRVCSDRLEFLESVRYTIPTEPLSSVRVPSGAVTLGEILVTILDVQENFLLIGFTRAFIVRIE